MPGYPGWFPVTFSSPVAVVNGTTYWIAITTDSPGTVAGAGAATPDTWYPNGSVGAADNPYAGSDIGAQQQYAVTVGDSGHQFGSTDLSAGPVLSLGGAQPVTADATLTVDRGMVYVTEIASDTQVAIALYTDVAGAPTVLLGESAPTTVTFDVPPPPPLMGGGVRIGIAFDDVTFEPSPTWTYISDVDNLVASYHIERGRQFEFDVTDTGTAQVTVNDPNGILDPTNTTGPYYTKLEPLLQIQIELYNPVDATYYSRFRGFIEEFDYGVSPSQVTSKLNINCVGIFAPLTAIEMQPDGTFGDTGGPPGFIFFDNANFDDRIIQVLGNAGIDPLFYVVFSGNIAMPESTYSPSQNVMEVVQDAANAEFPTVANVYEDRFGRLVAHGRLAKFDPVTTAMGADWDFHHWKCGDGTAVAASLSDTAHIRTFAFNRGLSKIFNQALCTPQGIADADIAGQVSTDPTSIGLRGIRSWSAENLKVESGTTTMNDALAETKLYADYIKNNYAQARNRVTELSFRSMDPSDPRAAANWAFLSQCDISDLLDITVDDPGGGGFNAEPGFIEGITEDAKPLAGAYAAVTLYIDWSPKAYFPGGYFS